MAFPSQINACNDKPIALLANACVYTIAFMANVEFVVPFSVE